MNNIFRQILYGLWEGYKELAAWAILIFLFLFFIIGGEIHIHIRWENVDGLIKSIKNYFKS